MIVSMNVSHFVKVCQVLTILHKLTCKDVANFGTQCRCFFDHVWSELCGFTSIKGQNHTVINRAICKTFNCYDSDTVNDVKHFLDVYDIRTVYQERRAAFLHKTSFLDNNVLQTVLVCCS